MSKQVVSAAQEGQEFTLLGERVSVGPKCDTNEGYWYCITHKIDFRNQLEKDFHITDDRHKLVWICYEHGPEVP